MKNRMKVTANDFVLHASAVITPKGVALFSGPSGSGKSTVASLVAQHTGWPVLADDTVHLWKRHDVWVAEDGCKVLSLYREKTLPFSFHNDGVVSVWYSIRQSTIAMCSKLTELEACTFMIQAWLEVAGHSSPYNPINGLRVFPGIVDFARTIQTRKLDCTLQLDTVRIVCEIGSQRILTKHAITGDLT